MAAIQFTNVYNLEGGMKAWEKVGKLSKNSLGFGIDRAGRRAQLRLKVKR